MKSIVAVVFWDEADWGILGKASELAAVCCGEVHAVFCGEETAEPAFWYGADEVYTVDVKDNGIDDYRTAYFLKQWAEQLHPEIILAPATVRMRGIMPILAGLLKAGLTADCTDLIINEKGRMIQIRPAFGNHLTAWIESISRIQMATVRPGIYRPRTVGKKKKPLKKLHVGGISRVRQLSFKPLKETCPLNQSRVILAGGMWIGSKENFQILAAVAKKTGAGLAASRKAVDAGFAPYSCQVGQTGVTVHPEIYIAVGISGAVQHLVGMSGAEKIIAINKDERAPIFDYADYGIVSDWKTVLQKLL